MQIRINFLFFGLTESSRKIEVLEMEELRKFGCPPFGGEYLPSYKNLFLIQVFHFNCLVKPNNGKAKNIFLGN